MSGSVTVSSTNHSGNVEVAILSFGPDLRREYPSTGTAIRIISGYPNELFVSNIPPAVFNCSICLDTANDPVMCGNQHTFCRACLLIWLKTQQSCPTCKVRPVTANSLVRNRAAAEIISGCKVRCLTAIPEEDSAPPAVKKRKTAKKADICNWVGTTETLDRHMQECGCIQVACEGRSAPDRCAWKGPRSALAEHRAECEYRSEACSYCGTDVQVHLMVLHKFAQCRQRPVVCHNVGCDVSCAYDNSDAHVRVCPREEIGCPYRSTLGCGFRCARNNMPAHAGDASVHFAGLMTSFQASQVTIGKLREDLEEQSTWIDTLQGENEELQQQACMVHELEEQNETVQEQEGMIQVLQEKYEALQQQTDTFKLELGRIGELAKWTRVWSCYDLVPAGDFRNYRGAPQQLQVSGFCWQLTFSMCAGCKNICAALEMTRGHGCPFQIHCHLTSTKEGEAADNILLSKKFTLSGAVGVEEVGDLGKWKRRLVLMSCETLDEWHREGHRLKVRTTVLFEIP
ncbi:hypothetical protein B484DRAFT_204985 [Ochromonadaceae sp. CCMP2298]|nr:hypothetical protein B484DRAFT_204985 [Ochromonadaceae sp. CCMP2298]